MKTRELESKETLLEQEIKFLGERVEKLELETRGREDQLEVEIKALRLFVEWLNANPEVTFDEFRDKVIHAINPERG